MENTIKRLSCLLLALVLALGSYGCGKRDIPPQETAQSESAGQSAEALPEYEDFTDSYTDALPADAADGLTLHAFNWTYAEIADNLENISNAGFKNVLTMPVQPPKSGGSAWWAFYQPLGFSIGDNSSLGTKDELVALCAKAEEYGICILADIVVNHLATTDDEGKEADGTPAVCPAVYDYEPRIYLNRNEDTDGTGVTFHHNRGASGSGAET